MIPLPITFLSDYGVGDDFAGVCRAVIARIAPGAQVIDITHGISRHDTRSGAAVLADALPFAPVGVHLAIVDPGVGGSRRAVAVRTAGEGHLLVGPDNGLLPPAVDVLGGAEQVVDISESPFRLEPASATFHGRDLFAPVAAQLAAGAELTSAGTEIGADELERHVVSRPRMEQHRAFAHAERIDGFGNITLDLTPADLEGHPLAGAGKVSIGSRSRRRTALRVASFGEVGEGSFLFYEDSSGRMAVAINRGSAAEGLEVRPGDELELEPAP